MRIAIVYLAAALAFSAYDYGAVAEQTTEYLISYTYYVAETEAVPSAIRVPVLAYHSIMSHEFYYPINVDNPWILSEEVFYAHMRFLYDNGFTALTSEQFMYFLFYGGDLPPNPVVITFDDGYLDNYLFAAPIMRQFGFTGMMFLITNAAPTMTPSMTAHPVQFMSAAEIIASSDVFEHASHSHAMHRTVDGRVPFEFESIETIRNDIRQSFEAPLNLFTAFAYPHGVHSPNAITALRAEGIRFAFATHAGYVYRRTDPFRLPRFLITSEWSMEDFKNIFLEEI